MKIISKNKIYNWMKGRDKKGLLLLGGYLEQYGLEQGYFLIFDFRKVNSEVSKVEGITVTLNGKEKR